MAEGVSADAIRAMVGVALSDADAAALGALYAAQARGVAAFPPVDLKAAEPPLRSVPGPPSMPTAGDRGRAG